MALGRIITDVFQEVGPMFSWVGELFGELMPELVKVVGYLLEADKVLVGIAALLVSVLVVVIKRRRSKRQSDSSVPGPMIPAFILGLLFGLVTLGSVYVLWRINVGGYIDESRMLVVAPALLIPVVISLFFLRSNSWQVVPLAIIAAGVALTAGLCIADFKVLL